jgi:transposase
MDREVLTDEQWERIAPLPPGKLGDPGRSGANNRLFVEAVLWLVRAGAPWRDLPPGFGKWGTVWKRFRRRAENGVFERVFATLSDEPVFEYALIDGTILKVHRHRTGARGETQNQAIGRSRGGLTTKIVALLDALGNLVRFVLLPGRRHDSVGVEPLLHGISLEARIGDKAFDSDWLRAELNERGGWRRENRWKRTLSGLISTGYWRRGHRSLLTSGAVFFRFGDGNPDRNPVTDQSSIERVECSGFATGGDVKGVGKIDVARCQIKGESHLLGILEDDIRQAGKAAERSRHVMPRKSVRTLQHPGGF